MQIVLSKHGFPIGHMLPDQAYWAAKLNNGTWLCELDIVAGMRPLDWTLDMVSTGDIKRIVELWLICPPTPTSPMGNTARLPITRPGTAFQLKIATADSSIVRSVSRLQAQMIGRVTDPETGDCECFIFDYQMEAMSTPWKSNIYNMGTWKPNIPGLPSIAPLGRLSLDVLGISL